MKALIFTLSLIIGTAHAECPPLKDVIPHLQTIADRLASASPTPINIGESSYTVHPVEAIPAVQDLIDGHFKGYSIHRYAETTKGLCEYLLTDDRTPARGSFHLRYATTH